jgi:hypothetical protein
MEFNQLMAKLRDRLSVVKSKAPPPPAVALTAWLEEIFNLRKELTGVPKTALRAIAKEEGVKPSDDAFRVLIDATAGTHVTPKMKGRYVDALNWCGTQSKSVDDFRSILKSGGGVNACGQKKRKRIRKTKYKWGSRQKSIDQI